jgi:hypothetical protein
MVVFDDSYGVISFYKDDFHLGSYYIYKLYELLSNKLLSGVYYNLIRRA